MSIPIEKLRHLQTKTVLIELASRIADQCVAQGREDLVAAVFLLEAMAVKNPAAVKEQRSRLLDIAAADDVTREVGEEIHQDMIDMQQAASERLSATLQ